MRCIEISTSDDRMDCRDAFCDPINVLPRKCSKCGFPDLNHIPQPYFLIKSRTINSCELAGADNGNFFVRERLRRVLETVASNQCTYFPTAYLGTSVQTPWYLAVPNHQVVTATVRLTIPRCAQCGEPRSAHPGTQWSEILFGEPPYKQQRAAAWTNESMQDILKSATWGSSESGWNRWMTRDFYFSVRLVQLLRKMAVKGFHPGTFSPIGSIEKAESEWVDQKLEVLRTAGIPLHSEGTLAEADAKWLRKFIKANTDGTHLDADLKAVERKLKLKLPKSYCDFIQSVGPRCFQDIDEQTGFEANILPPNELTFERGYDEFEDEESKAVDGLMFACTQHGDCFCFDVQKHRKEFAVVLYKHEGNYFEPYAENFAACIRRFAKDVDV